MGSNFLEGLIKLEQNIFDSLEETPSGKVNNVKPFIDIPKEFDATYGLSLSPDLGSVRNIPSIYDLYIGDIKAMTDLKNPANPLARILKEETDEGYVSETAANFAHNTLNLMDQILRLELHKEICDAYYMIMSHIARDVAQAFYNDSPEYFKEGEIRRELFRSLENPGLVVEFMQWITESRLYQSTVDNYSLYNYVFLFRQRIMAYISMDVYNKLRQFLYYYEYTPSNENETFDLCYNRITFDYLYVLDNIINIICVTFQQKIVFCHNDISNFVEEMDKAAPILDEESNQK